jgi:DNA-binding response OmpR family regulator
MRNIIDSRSVATGRRVFVVDDNDISRATLHYMLPVDIESSEMTTFDAAVEMAKHSQPNLVMVSELMVARSKSVLLHQMRAIWPAAKLLVICGAADDECRSAALAAGADDALTRPFRVESVRHTVNHLLRMNQSAAQSTGRSHKAKKLTSPITPNYVPSTGRTHVTA